MGDGQHGEQKSRGCKTKRLADGEGTKHSLLERKGGEERKCFASDRVIKRRGGKKLGNELGILGWRNARVLLRGEVGKRALEKIKTVYPPGDKTARRWRRRKSSNTKV